MHFFLFVLKIIHICHLQNQSNIFFHRKIRDFIRKIDILTCMEVRSILLSLW